MRCGGYLQCGLTARLLAAAQLLGQEPLHWEAEQRGTFVGWLPLIVAWKVNESYGKGSIVNAWLSIAPIWTL